MAETPLWVYAKVPVEAQLGTYMNALMVAAFFGWEIWEDQTGDRGWMCPTPVGYTLMGCYCHCTPLAFWNPN